MLLSNISSLVIFLFENQKQEQAMKTIINTKKEKAKRDTAKAVAAVTPLKKPTGRKVRFS